MDEKKSIIQEVREARRQIAEQCGNDLRKITEHALEVAHRLGFTTVRVV